MLRIVEELLVLLFLFFFMRISIGNETYLHINSYMIAEVDV